MTITSETIVVCRDESYCSGDESVVFLSDLIESIDEDKAQAFYERLVSLDVEQQHATPLYALIHTQIWGSNQYHEHVPTFDHLFPLYRELDEYVTQDTEQIVARGISGRHLDMVKDLADNRGLDLQTEAVEPESTNAQRQLLGQLPWLVVSVIDMFLSLLLRPIYNKSDADVLVKYPLFRPETFSPIEDRLTVRFDVTTTLLTIKSLSKSSVINDKTNFVPFRCFASIREHIQGYRAVIKSIVDIFYTHETEAAVVDAIEAETGIRMEQTVSEIFSRSAANNLDAYLYYPIADHLFDSGAYEATIITSSGPSGQTIAVPATKNNGRTVNLGHSIISPPQWFDTQYYDVRIIEGTIVERLSPNAMGEEFVPAGLAKHIELYEQYDQPAVQIKDDGSGAERRRLLVATQPYPDKFREQLLREIVVETLERTDWEVVVKLHPAESQDFYRCTLSGLGYPPDEIDKLSIIDGGLYKWIRDSDLVLTITSNVGIEAVILGTPAAVYNAWSPLIRTPLYAKYGPVPLLRSTDEVLELLNDDLSTAARWERQRPVIQGPYRVEKNSLDQVAKTVEREL